MRSHRICLLICTVLISTVAHADGDTNLRIVAPESGTTVHDNNGTLNVTVEVKPGLHAGDRLILLLDDKAIESGTGTRYHLTGIVRGSHTLRVQAIRADGRLIAASQTVKFNMWHASRLFPKREQ